MREKSGPALGWDSTRSDPAINPEDREFTTYISATSAADPRDDVFPRAVQVVIVVDDGNAGAATRLSRDIDESTTRIPVDDDSAFSGTEYKYVKIDGEWIRYSDRQRGTLVLESESGRGARWSMPASHEAGTLVKAGKTFTLTLRLPGGREDWNGR
jgi:hypothetical protein